jgi:hypothetical protein
MKKLVILGVLAGGWYVHSNDLIPDLGLWDGWSNATEAVRRVPAARNDGSELDRIQRMEADLDAQIRYLDERAARVQELKAGVTPPRNAIPARARNGANPNLDEYNREVETLNDGVVRFRRLYATYRDDVDHYNAQARRAGYPVHRPMEPRVEGGNYRPVLASIKR